MKVWTFFSVAVLVILAAALSVLGLCAWAVCEEAVARASARALRSAPGA